jgi:hypothetical protein
MKHLLTEIQIDAPPEKVWGVLAAGPNWGAWNPFVVRVEGELRMGATLTNTLVMPGKKPMVFKPKVLKADGSELRWKGRLLIPGLFDGEHYFQVRAHAGGTAFVHGEIFSGILIGMLNVDQVRECFEAFNRGLKAHAEQDP